MPPMPEGYTLIEKIEWIFAMSVIYGIGLMKLIWGIAMFIAPFALIWLVIRTIRKDRKPDEWLNKKS